MPSRRSFFSTLATAVAGFTILPPATTYARIWKATRPPIINPDWVNAEYEMKFIFDPRALHSQWSFETPPLRFTLDSNQQFQFIPLPNTEAKS